MLHVCKNDRSLLKRYWHTCHLRMFLLSASRALPGHDTLIVAEMLFSAEKSIPAQKFFPCPCSNICEITTLLSAVSLLEAGMIFPKEWSKRDDRDRIWGL